MPSSSDLGATKTASTKTKSNSIIQSELVLHVLVSIHSLCTCICTAQSAGACRWLTARQSADGCAVGRYYSGAVCRATQSADDVTELLHVVNCNNVYL